MIKEIPADFKVLIIYSNTHMEPLMPLGVASIVTSLESGGFTVKLFDTTWYKSEDYNDSQSARTCSLQIKPVDYSEVGIKEIDNDPVEDFVKLVYTFKPDLIGLSCVELTYKRGLRLLDSIKELRIPNIVGGCFATFSPDCVLSNDLVDMVCAGEGENTILELARKMSSSGPLDDIANLWFKKEGRIVRPKKLDLVDIDSVPVPRFDSFAPERIYRAMDGRIYRMLPVEFSRGCPYQCTFCSAPAYAKKFRDSGRWLRFKTIDQVMNEIDFYVKEYKAEYFYFISECFLAMPLDFKHEFYKRYKKYSIPFWFNTRPETVNDKDITMLADTGCHRISIGIENGNEDFRRRVLKRHYSNETVLKAIDTVLKSKIQLSVNNMIGFPDETRDIIFDTIELNRKFKAGSHSVSIFQPFRGTELYDYCVSKGYWDSDRICSESFAVPVLQMPTLTKEEIEGLYRTFNLYINLDKSFWPDIRKAEHMDKDGDKAFFELSQRLCASQV